MISGNAPCRCQHLVDIRRRLDRQLHPDLKRSKRAGEDASDTPADKNSVSKISRRTNAFAPRFLPRLKPSALSRSRRIQRRRQKTKPRRCSRSQRILDWRRPVQSSIQVVGARARWSAHSISVAGGTLSATKGRRYPQLKSVDQQQSAPWSALSRCDRRPRDRQRDFSR